MIERCPYCERELLFIIDEDGKWLACPNYMCDFTIEKTTECWWCGEEGSHETLQGYDCCMAPKCIGAVVLEIDELEEYKNWKKSKKYDGANLLEYVRRGGYEE